MHCAKFQMHSAKFQMHSAKFQVPSAKFLMPSNYLNADTLDALRCTCAVLFLLLSAFSSSFCTPCTWVFRGTVGLDCTELKRIKKINKELMVSIPD